MEQNKIDLFIATMGNRFPSFKLMMIAEMLKKVDDSKMVLIQSMQYKDPTLFLVVSILVGHFGVDRFMLGQTGLGVAKLLTCGGLGIWTIVDWFLIMNETREMNFQMFNQVIHGSGAYQYQ